MIRIFILVFFLIFPFITNSQEEWGQETTNEVPIGSSGIDLAPEEEVSTPTEPQKMETETSEPAPSPTPDTSAPPEVPSDSPPAESQPATSQ
jgi:hypothetical protein